MQTSRVAWGIYHLREGPGDVPGSPDRPAKALCCSNKCSFAAVPVCVAIGLPRSTAPCIVLPGWCESLLFHIISPRLYSELTW